MSEENSDDGKVTKSSNSTKSSTNENRMADQDTINISDDDENRNDVREPSRFEPSMEPRQIERPPTFKSVREYFGKDEAVYVMDAKTTGNIGRYLNVNDYFYFYTFASCESLMMGLCVLTLFFFPALLRSKCICTKCFCRYA